MKNLSEKVGKTHEELYNYVNSAIENMLQIRGALEILDYSLFSSSGEENKIVKEGDEVFCSIQYGCSEGIYLDIYIINCYDRRRVMQPLATYKTLCEGEEDFVAMGEIAGAFQFYADEYISKHGLDEKAFTEAEPETLTVGLLKELMAGRNIPELRKLCDGESDSHKLSLFDADGKETVGYVYWGVQDIKYCLEETGYPATEENVSAVITDEGLKVLSECSDKDWEAIYDAIKRHAKK